MSGLQVVVGMRDLIARTERVAAGLEALVEQQRIANLIALSGRGYAHEDALAELGNEAGYTLIKYERTPATPTDGPDDVPMTRPEIKEALGLP